MSRLGGVTAPVKCEGNVRTAVEIKQEQSDGEDAYGASQAKRLAE